MTTSSQHGLAPLDRQECLTLLRTRYVGRVGYVDDGARPVIVPVNYRIEQDGSAVFLTAEGRKLDAARAGRTLCLEVDAADDLYKVGWSVLLTGPSCVADPASSAEDARELHLRTWAREVPRTHLVRISPERIEGRRLRSGP